MQTITAALFILCTLITTVRCVSVEFKAEYFSNVTLECDSRLLNLPRYTVYKLYWILPDGTDIQWSHDPGNTSRYIVSPFPIFNLTISHVTDDDFGWYRCVILWDDYIFLVHSMNIGLNVDGALYDDLLEEYKKSGVIGLLVGGSTAILIGLLCLLYWCRYSETNRVNENKNGDDDKKLKTTKPSNTTDITDEEDVMEKEVIYELDKAVNSYDVEETTINNDGEVALICTKQLADDSIDNSPNGEPVLQANEVLADTTVSQNDHDDIIDCYDRIPPPPPPPPESLPEEQKDEMNTCDDVIYFNRAFEADDYVDDNAKSDDTANFNVEFDNDISVGDIKSHFDTMKSFTFQEELLARLMSQDKEKEETNEEARKANSDDDFDRVRF